RTPMSTAKASQNQGRASIYNGQQYSISSQHLQLQKSYNTTLATWGQLKLIKNATRKERKPIWFRYLKSITLQDADTRKIKDDLSIDADLKRLAIPTLQKLSSDNRVKDWSIGRNSTITPSQSKLEKCKKYSLSIDPLQESCTLRLSKKRILGALSRDALEPLTKITKIKSSLWQGVQNKQQSNPESVLLGLKNLKCLEIELIQKQHFDNKLSLQLIEELRCIKKKAKWKSITRLKTGRNRKIPKKEEEALEQEKPENQR
ncbi:6614_t:CDS:2, partial [Gigaspora margarita]